MSLEVSKSLGSVGYTPKEYPIYYIISRWNNPLILTIDPNFQPNIQGITQVWPPNPRSPVHM